MTISLIAAMTPHRVIGQDGQIPWHLPSDLKRFAEITAGHSVVMGRKTYDSLPDKFRPLPRRKNIVLSHQLDLGYPESVMMVSDGRSYLRFLAEEREEIFVIGGAEIYRLALPLAQKLYLTIVHATCTGKIFFPEIDHFDWRIISPICYIKEPDDQFAYDFRILERVGH